MPIDFPNNPISGQTYSYNSITWEYNGVAWDKQGGGGSVGPQGNTGATGPQGNTGATGPVGDYVTTFNGLTGAVTGVTTGTANTFIASQTISGAFVNLKVANTIFGNTAEYNSNNISAYSGTGSSQTFSFSPTNPSNLVALPSYTTTLAGLAGTQTFTGTNTFNAVTNFSGGISGAGASFNGLISANAGISASGITVAGSIVLQNLEFIRNSTNGRIDFMPAPVGATHYGLYVDTTSWGFGPALGTIRSSDGALNVANILWDTGLYLGNNVIFAFGSNGQNGLVLSDTGNNTVQLYTNVTTGTNSGAFAIVDNAGVNTANRAPGTTHTNPNLYIYRAGSARATDFIRFEHDGSTGYMISGGTSDIELMPGSGIVGVSGNIQVLQNQIYVTNNARSWFL